jgi:curved DNA-binding protein CbpA
MNHYVLLGVPIDADPDTIRSAFRALVRRYHPDAGQGSSADRFRQIVAAYETLNDPVRREQYDRTLRVRRPRPAQYVEALASRTAPEPLLGRPRGSAPGHPADQPLRRPRHDGPEGLAEIGELMEELLRSCERLFFGGTARRSRR